MAVNQYDSGTTLYVTAIATTVSAGALPIRNPLFTRAVQIIIVAMGTLYSSPSDIFDTGDNWEKLKELINNVVAALKEADSKLSDEALKNMGEAEYREALKQFFEETDKTKGLTSNIGDALKQLANLSLIVAIICLTGSGILLTVSAASVAGKFVPGLGVAVEAIKMACAKIFSKSLLSIMKKNGMAMGIIASLVGLVSSFLSNLVGNKLSKAASPTTSGSLPNFKKVVIEGLPTSTSTSTPISPSGIGGLSLP